MYVWRSLLPAVLILASACANTPETTTASADPAKPKPVRVSHTPNPYPSTYKPLPSEDVLIRNATVLDGPGGRSRTARC